MCRLFHEKQNKHLCPIAPCSLSLSSRLSLCLSRSLSVSTSRMSLLHLCDCLLSEVVFPSPSPCQGLPLSLSLHLPLKLCGAPCMSPMQAPCPYLCTKMLRCTQPIHEGCFVLLTSVDCAAKEGGVLKCETSAHVGWQAVRTMSVMGSAKI